MLIHIYSIKLRTS